MNILRCNSYSSNYSLECNKKVNASSVIESWMPNS